MKNLVFYAVCLSLLLAGAAGAAKTPEDSPVVMVICGYTPSDEGLEPLDFGGASGTDGDEGSGGSSEGAGAEGASGVEIDSREISKSIRGAKKYEKEHGAGSFARLARFWLGTFGPQIARRSCMALNVAEVSAWFSKWLIDEYGADPKTWPEPEPKGEVPGWQGPNFPGATNVK